MQHILILGVGYGGLLTALRLQPQIKQGKAQVTLVNAIDTFTERIRLHQVATGQTLKQYSIPQLLKGTGVNFVQDFVRHIDPKTQTVTLDHDILDYDVLVMSLGSRVDRTAVDGINEFAHTLDPQSAKVLHQRLQNGGKLLIIGGGLTGIEMAGDYAERQNIDVHLVTGGQVGAGVSEKGRNHIRETLQNMGVTVTEHVKVSALHEAHADTSSGQINYDAVLWAGGFSASPLVAESGFTINAQGQMLVRDTLQSVDYDNVYGVGDCASVTLPSGDPQRMACATAMPMGAHSADNIANDLAGQSRAPFRFGYMLQCISIGRHNGLIQFVESDDTPKDRILTGRSGAWVKELICRYTVWSLQLEKRFPGMYWFPQVAQEVEQNVLAKQS